MDTQVKERKTAQRHGRFNVGPAVNPNGVAYTQARPPAILTLTTLVSFPPTRS
jgi:hypothetical protein